MSRQRKRLPENPVTTQIETLSHDGRGIARIQGKTTFISGALPGETVTFYYCSQKKHFDEGIVVEVLEPASIRVTPQCAHFGVCGGCNLQHLSSAEQITLKQATLLELLQHIGKVQPERMMPPLTGTDWGYRRKARLGVKYVEKKQTVLVGFREQYHHFIAELTQCDVLHPRIGQQISALRELLLQFEARHKIAQIEVAMGDLEVAFIFRNLIPLSKSDQQKLIDFSIDTGIYIYLQSGGPDTVQALYPPDLPLTSLNYTLPTEDITIHFAPNDFTQINFEINRQMVGQALKWLALQKTDTVLELFCGLGNFTLPLARKVAHVVGVEGEASLLARANMNAQRQNIDNITYHTADLTKTTLSSSWTQQTYEKVLLDPPRSGALEILQVLPFTNTQHLVYVSCNPSTFARDAKVLVYEKGFRLVQVGVMDMFPHTAHIESMALFSR